LNEIIWKTLIYNGETYEQFEVSNDGQLRNVKTGTVYKQTLGGHGYRQVCVSLGSRNNIKAIKIHKAVAETFIPNHENKSDVNHKDGNKENNIVLNLEWATHKENMQHASKTGLVARVYGIDNASSKLTENDVKYIRENYVSKDKKYGARALGRMFNIDHTCILDIINGVSYINI
jgi:hypothetical protein